MTPLRVAGSRVPRPPSELTLLANSSSLAAPDDPHGAARHRPSQTSRIRPAPNSHLHTRGHTVPDFVQTAVKEIDEQLRVLKDEAARLEAARAALTGGRRRVGRAARTGSGRAPARPASGRNARSGAPRQRRGGHTRANQALELVREKPG